MSNHTPGPWKVSGEAINARDILAGKRKVASLLVDRGNRGTGVNTYKAMKANAKLIAAAPEMLEALHLMKMQMQSDLNDGRILQKVDRNAREMILKITLQAIHKAEGPPDA